MNLPKDIIFHPHDDGEEAEDAFHGSSFSRNDMIRRTSVIYYLLVNGACHGPLEP